MSGLFLCWRSCVWEGLYQRSEVINREPGWAASQHGPFFCFCWKLQALFLKVCFGKTPVNLIWISTFHTYLLMQVIVNAVIRHIIAYGWSWKISTEYWQLALRNMTLPIPQPPNLSSANSLLQERQHCSGVPVYPEAEVFCEPAAERHLLEIGSTLCVNHSRKSLLYSAYKDKEKGS